MTKEQAKFKVGDIIGKFLQFDTGTRLAKGTIKEIRVPKTALDQAYYVFEEIGSLSVDYVDSCYLTIEELRYQHPEYFL